MIKQTLTQFINHVIEQNQWAKPILKPFAGKTVRFVMPPVQARLTVLEHGGLAMAGEVAEADATIVLPFLVAVRLMANDAQAANGILIDGDAELAATVAKVLRQMSWHVEEDLSQVVGDVAAYKMSATAKTMVKQGQQGVENLAEMLVEYWQEEKPLLAKKPHVEKFNQAVDGLRDDVARLEKRVEAMMRALAEESAVSQADTSPEVPNVEGATEPKESA